MKKTILLAAAGLMLIGLFTMALGFAINGFGLTGDYTGDDTIGVEKKNVYCEVFVEGNYNMFSGDLELSQLECRTDKPFFMAENLGIFDVAEGVECTGYLKKNNEVVTTGNTKELGDFSTYTEKWYKFGISQVPVGAYTAEVQCESRDDPDDFVTIQEEINVG
jgi:hypothetical protein